jgi:tetratricopeptide (TPR) repeat protein
MTRTRWVLALFSVACLFALAFAYARRSFERNPIAQQPSPSPADVSVTARYADPESCAVCHVEIARTYAQTGMGRSFSRLEKGSGAIFPIRTQENYTRPLFHKPSDRHYAMVEREGKLYQRRHQIGFDGKETNVIEVEAHYVIGSGNHARTFLHRNAQGQLVQLPVSWYAERGGYWAMSPGYDRPAHLDFRRVIDVGCMSCHNGYPPSPVNDVGGGPKFPDSLSNGIDCQRCHGPGQRHIDAIQARDVDAARRSIVNPATLDRDRQLETCMQCHLEPTSSPLPFQIRRYDRAPFSYIPGQTLGDHFIYFDHAPGSGRDDKFEIAGDAYRLRKSACFQQSQMTCATCHDPHDIPRGAKAVQHYVAVCRSCHQQTHVSGVPSVAGAKPAATCIECHMPKRRTEDAVHVVMTDHYIQRRRAAGDLLAPRKEADNFERGSYRGDVVLYYPPTLASTAENELYVALAQVQQGSNLAAGIPRLEQAIEKHKPRRAEFYYELARAYAKTSSHDNAVRWSEEALRRDANFTPALKELAAAAMTRGMLTQAAPALEKAVTLQNTDSAAFADLGNAFLQLDRIDEAQKALQRALTLDPDLPRAHNAMGLAALKKGQLAVADTHFRAAIRSQPDLAEAHNNLGNLLASRQSYPEAAYHFEQAIISDANYSQAHHSLGMVLGLTRSYPRAVTHLQAAIRLAPTLAQPHLDLGDVLASMGRMPEAAREYDLAIQKTGDPEVRDAALEALRRLKR